MTELNPLTKELAETLKELRTRFDNYQHLGPSMVRVDAVLDRYDDLCKQPESPMIKTVSYDNIKLRQKLFDAIESVFYTSDYNKVHWRQRVNIAVDEILMIIEDT